MEAAAACVAAGIFRAEDPQVIAEVRRAAVHGVVSLELAGHFADSAVAEERFATVARAAGAWFRMPPPDVR